MKGLLPDPEVAQIMSFSLPHSEIYLHLFDTRLHFIIFMTEREGPPRAGNSMTGLLPALQSHIEGSRCRDDIPPLCKASRNIY